MLMYLFFIFGKKLSRAYVLIVYITYRIEIKFYLLTYLLTYLTRGQNNINIWLTLIIS